MTCCHNKPSSQFQSEGLFSCFPQACRLYDNNSGIYHSPEPWFSSCNSLKWFHICVQSTCRKAAVLLHPQTRICSDLLDTGLHLPWSGVTLQQRLNSTGGVSACRDRYKHTLYTSLSHVCVITLLLPVNHTKACCDSHHTPLPVHKWSSKSETNEPSFFQSMLPSLEQRWMETNQLSIKHYRELMWGVFWKKA